MDLSEVVNIAGKPGLYKIVVQNASRIIVESLDTGKRIPVFARDNFSILKDISIFTYEDDQPLEDVFAKIYEVEKGKETVNHNSAAKDLASNMLKVLPEYDKENVHTSDMKKLFKWYNILVAKKLWSPDDIKSATSSSEEEE